MTKPNSTELIFVVDRSGSMESIAADMIGGFDSFIKKQKEYPGECRVSLSRFDNVYESVFTSLLLSDVPSLELVPRGSTALLDAMARAIDGTGARFSTMREDERPEKVLFITITDGHENASRESTWEGVKNRIQRQEQVYKWQFIFLGANFDAVSVANDLGIRAGNAARYQASKTGAQALFTAASVNIGAIRGGDLAMNASLLDQQAYNTALADVAKPTPTPPDSSKP